MPARCAHAGCGKQARYGLIKRPEGKLIGGVRDGGIFCSIHRPPGTVNVVEPLCEDCGVIANWGFPDERRTRCASHRIQRADGTEMVQLGQTNALCRYVSPGNVRCTVNAYFNWVGQKSGLFCKLHAEEGMINVRNAICGECGTQASYGHVGGRPEFCAGHRKPQMVDLKSSKCRCGSGGYKVYGLFGEKPTHCSSCRDPDLHVNVIAPYCTECDTQASYGLEEGRPIHCATHRGRGEGIVTSARCRATNCGKASVYGLPDQRPQYCGAHRPPGTEDTRSVRCKRGGLNGCKVQAKFGFPGKGREACSDHTAAGMVFVVSGAVCLALDDHGQACKSPPVFGLSCGSPEYCDAHAPQQRFYAQLLDLRHAACVGGCDKVGVLDPQSRKCLGCDPEGSSRTNDRRLAILMPAIQSNATLAGLIFATDRGIGGGGRIGRARPDLHLKKQVEGPGVGGGVLTLHVIVEVDEEQHQHTILAKGQAYEYTRMALLHEVLKAQAPAGEGVATHFVRYNPDSFKTADGKRVSISNLKRTEREAMLQALLEHVFSDESLLELTPGALTFIRIFYDTFGWNLRTRQPLVPVSELPRHKMSYTLAGPGPDYEVTSITVVPDVPDVLDGQGRKVDYLEGPRGSASGRFRGSSSTSASASASASGSSSSSSSSAVARARASSSFSSSSSSSFSSGVSSAGAGASSSS